MTSDITLELDHDSIRLLRRGRDGEAELGRVPLGAPDFGARLVAIRNRAGMGPVEASMLLPPSLVLFLDAGDAEGAELEARIAERTSCPIGELVVGRSGRLAAAVERTTLEEARDFAIHHGFRPVSYAARRKRGEGEVFFRIEPLTFRSNRPQPAEGAAVEPDSGHGTPASEAPAAKSARKPPRPRTTAPASTGEASAPKTPAGTAPAGADPVPALVTPPVIAARSEEEALTIFGARDREPRRRGLTPLHAAAAVLAAAVLLATYGLFTGEPEDVQIVGVQAAVENTLDPILEGQPEAQVVVATAPDPETRQEPAPRQAAAQPAPRIGHEAVALDSPRAAPTPVPSLPPETTPSQATELAALAPPPDPTVEVRAAFARPPPPGTVFDMDERGLVRPSEDGAPTPQGVLVYSGPPAVLPPDRAGDAPADPLAAEATPIEPAPQMAGSDDDDEDATLAAPQEGLSLAGPEIVRLRPEARPETESPDIVVVAETAGEDTPRPRDRPAGVEQVTVTSAGPADTPDFDALARQARTDRAAAATGLSATRAAEPPREAPVGEANVAVEPTLPTRASVADRATLANAIRLDRANLIGVYGSPSDRRALIRLPTGRYVKVKVGDRVDGGRVAAIAASSLEYVKDGQRYALTMPNG